MIQVYTGDGKGKTTAALGLALRASGAGQKVYICQFLKGRYSCELASLKKLKNIKVGQFGTGCFIKGLPAKKDIALAKKALAAASRLLRGGKCDMLILDELNAALNLGLLELKDVLKLISSAPEKTELVITGRNAPPEILERADLVSEVKEVRHYFRKGINARKGIEY